MPEQAVQVTTRLRPNRILRHSRSGQAVVRLRTGLAWNQVRLESSLFGHGSVEMGAGGFRRLRIYRGQSFERPCCYFWGRAGLSKGLLRVIHRCNNAGAKRRYLILKSWQPAVVA